jgi:hypothetical protein
MFGVCKEFNSLTLLHDVHSYLLGTHYHNEIELNICDRWVE